MAINKQLSEINVEDLQALQSAAIRESKTVEYKERISIDNDDQKRKFLAAVASFANASGGDIIYGIKAPAGLPEQIIPLNGVDLDSAVRTLRDLIRAHIEPPIFGIDFKEVVLPDGAALVLRVPKGWSGPYMVTYNNDNRFYTRDANGRVLMNIPEIRLAFLGGEHLAERLRRFRLERLSAIRSAELPITLSDGPKLVLHMFPLDAFGSAQPNLNALLVRSQSHLRPMEVESGYGTTHDLDGVYSFERQEKALGYSAILRNGCVEVVQRFSGGQKVIPNPMFEQKVIQFMPNVVGWLRVVEMAPPFVIMLSLLDVAGLVLQYGPFNPLFGIRTIRQRDLIMHEAIIHKLEPLDPASILRPFFDSLWQACGLTRSLNYDENGNWKPRNWN